MTRETEAIAGNKTRDLWNEVKMIKDHNNIVPWWLLEIAEVFSQNFKILYNSVPYDDAEMDSIQTEINKRLLTDSKKSRRQPRKRALFVNHCCPHPCRARIIFQTSCLRTRGVICTNGHSHNLWYKDSTPVICEVFKSSRILWRYPWWHRVDKICQWSMTCPSYIATRQQKHKHRKIRQNSKLPVSLA